jgi:hypothetical protein
MQLTVSLKDIVALWHENCMTLPTEGRDETHVSTFSQEVSTGLDV